MVVRTYAPVGETPILHENLTRDHLSVMSGITLEGKLYMLEQDKAFSREKMWCVSWGTSCTKSPAGCSLSGTALLYIALGQ
jgi:hypothetical protein